MKCERVLTLSLVLSGLLLFLGLLPIHGEAAIYDTALRLHVIAASDSAEDQALKLEVRDAVLSVTVPLLSGCSTRDEAASLLSTHENEILSAASSAIASAGRSDPVSLSLGMEDYPTRDYDGFCFPSGSYLSLRVMIGSASGHNWWCCLFPPLCLGAASVPSSSAEDACVSVGLTPSQYKIITSSSSPVYKVRFKFLELFQGAR